MRWSLGPRVSWLALFAVVLVAGCSATAGNGDRPAVDEEESKLPRITFTTAGGEQVKLAVEVADEGQEMGCGLMHRTSLPEEQGMLFAYERDGQTGGFWMRNTLIPLAIAYVAGDGRIVDIIEMQETATGVTPYRTQDGGRVLVPDGQAPPPGLPIFAYPPRGSYQYAIEANKGWYDRHSIAVNDRVDVAEALARSGDATPYPICSERGL